MYSFCRNKYLKRCKIRRTATMFRDRHASVYLTNEHLSFVTRCPFFSGNCIDREPCELGDKSGRLMFYNGLLCWKWHFYWHTFNVRKKKIYICSSLQRHFSSVYIQWSAPTDLLCSIGFLSFDALSVFPLFQISNVRGQAFLIPMSLLSRIPGYKGTALFNRREHVRKKNKQNISWD